MNRVGLSIFFAWAAGCGESPLPFGAGPVEIPAEALVADESGEPPWCEAHRQRNQYEQDLCPGQRPFAGYTDPRSGITFGEEEWWNYYHWPDTCHRGSGGVLESITFDEPTLAMLEALGVDPEEITPGVQCCYDSETDELTDSGSFDFQSPPQPMELLLAQPSATDRLRQHLLLDVLTDEGVCLADREAVVSAQAYHPPPPQE